MIHKWLGDLFDTLLYLGIVTGMLMFFCWYWKEEYQVRYAEVIMQEFLDSTSAEGKITLEKYERMVRNLKRVASGYEIEITCVTYEQKPIYELIPKEELDLYYMSRNVKREIALWEDEIVVAEEAVENLFLQTETNAGILATVSKEYIPLPEENEVTVIEAVRNYQEVYEGESLITLCRVSSPKGNYYVEAGNIFASESGIVMLELVLAGELHLISVEVLCHPRSVVCSKGHEIVNSQSILEEAKKTGKINCPYCKMIPEYVICNTPVLQKKTGKKLSKEEVWLMVQYLDGHEEIVTPEMEEWQDNFDENYCGVQQVVIRYRGKEEMITVVSVNNNCFQCEMECSARNYADYNAFPYCTSCMSKVPLFTGKVYEEEQQITNGEVLSRLDSEGELSLNSGALINLHLTRNEVYESMLQKEVKEIGKRR